MANKWWEGKEWEGKLTDYEKEMLDEDLGYVNEPKSKKGKEPKSKWYAPKPRCHESHPVLSVGGGTLVGGACSKAPDGFDVYVGLDYSMDLHPKSYPWADSRIEVVHYPITDYKAPGDSEEFVAMIHWLVAQLQAGKKVHVGCMGGHGRTGTVLAAILALTGEKNAIAWVREHYCKKAVESAEQVDFLVKHFQCVKAEPAKIYSAPATHEGKGAKTNYTSGAYNTGGVVHTSFDSMSMEDFRNRPRSTDSKTYHPVSGARKKLW